MDLTPDDVRRVARLARLDLDDDEVARQAGHLNALIHQFDRLQQLDVTGIEPTSHSIPMANALRADAAGASLPRDEALANAPEARDGAFVVPRIIADR